jgi:hypothetical protein
MASSDVTGKASCIGVVPDSRRGRPARRGMDRVSDTSTAPLKKVSETILHERRFRLSREKVRAKDEVEGEPWCGSLLTVVGT